MHDALIGVALPRLFVGARHGQITGSGLEGFYGGGRRLLSRCRLRVAGREPTPLQARMVRADRAAFVGLVSASGSPDPVLIVERVRVAAGRERIVVRSAAQRALRLPVEVSLGTDLADIDALVNGHASESVPAGVCSAGLRWSSADADCVVTADPPPDDALAKTGLLRWNIQLPPSGTFVVDLIVQPFNESRARAGQTGSEHAAGEPARLPERRMRAGPGGRAGARTKVEPTGLVMRRRKAVEEAAAPPRVGPGSRGLLSAAEAICSDARASRMLRTCLQDLRGLLVPDPEHAGELHLAAGVPWRCGLSPGEAVAAARMCLPLGTGLAVGTMRTLARAQHQEPGRQFGLLLGSRQHSTSSRRVHASAPEIEATLLFPALLAEARRWGLPDHEAAPLVPTAQRCLDWLRRAVGDGFYVPAPGPRVLFRAATQAHAHRAAVLGADLLEAYGRPRAEAWRQWARELRGSFRRDFWVADHDGGRPAAYLTDVGQPHPALNSRSAHLLDPGLSAAGEWAPALLDGGQTARLVDLLGGPAMNSGWGLRSLGTTERGFSPLGRRNGAVHLHDTAVAAAGLVAAGRETEAVSLIRGALRVSQAFGHRLPEMVGGLQRVQRSVPLPHPAACRPAATAAAGALHMLIALVGVRPDVPAGTVTLRPARSVPLGDLTLTGLELAGRPFTARVNGHGLAMVEEVKPGVRLRT